MFGVTDATNRTEPLTVLLGLVICIVYVAILITLQKLSGIPYPEIAKNADTLRKGVLIPVAICTALLAAFAAATGRLLPAFSIDRVDAPWLWVIPVLFAAMIAVQFSRARWALFDRRAIVFMVLGTAVVGLSEELLVRGVFVDLLQESGYDLRWIAVISSIVFGLLHGLNILNGQSAKTTITQVLLTTLIGLGLFAALMVSGTLWLPILIHFLMDFAVLARGGTVNEDDERPSAVQAVLVIGMYVLALASLIAY